MKVLVIGSGGREHALVWKLAQSSHATEMYCAPGNAGISLERLAQNESLVQCVPIGAEELSRLADFALEKSIDLTVVGPDNPLALGIVDHFQARGLRIWGPNQKAAQFESSKAFSQKFMERHGIPTARARITSDPAEARQFAVEFGGRCVVKADGLALGKGVLVCRDLVQTERALEEILVRKSFGAAGARVVVQELLEGTEVSLHAMCDGYAARLFPSSQDHKRALDGDLGLNTGGMGTYSPTPFLSAADFDDIQRAIIDPWLRGCQADGIDYRGILYPGIMLTADGPRVIEFNARFGDPETQSYLPRMKNDLLEVLLASIAGTLEEIELEWREEHCCCVVMASGGYPGSYAKGKEIHGLDTASALDGTKVFHAGTAFADGRIVTNGGRVLGATAWGSSLRVAVERAYRAVDLISFEGAQFRKDIGQGGLRAKQDFIKPSILSPRGTSGERTERG